MGVLLVLLFVAVLVIIRLVEYRARHPFTSDDVEDARGDSLARSQSVVNGKAMEELAPYLPGFEFNPRDVRHLGSPVDYVVFDGLSEGQVRGVYLLEVNSGRAALTRRERQVRDAVQAGHVGWRIWRVSSDTLIEAMRRPGVMDDGEGPHPLEVPFGPLA